MATIENNDLQTLTHAISLIDSIDKLSSYGKDEARRETVREALQQRNFEPLREYLSVLLRSTSQAQQSNKGFEKVCSSARESCQDAATECLQKSAQAKSNKTTSRVVGGTATAAVLGTGAASSVAATGIVISAFAGLLTLGVGTVVGLIVTAAASGTVGLTVGTGAAIATHCFASGYKATGKTFAELADTFKSLSSASVTTLTHLSIVGAKLDTFKKAADDVEYCRTDNQVDSISVSFDYLFQQFTECSAVIASCRIKLRSLIQGSNLPTDSLQPQAT